MKVNTNLSNIYKKDTIKESNTMKQWINWFDSLKVNPLLSYFSQDDIALIYKIATSPAMHCDMKKKYRLLGELMEKRGFRLIGGGTNRRAYECIYDNRVVAKIATDHIGFVSNIREYKSQNVLKPFCNKIFEISPCGSIAIIEKVVPIKEIPEFQKYGGEIFDILFHKIRCNDIAMDDIGTRSMKNWGYRSGFGPVLLDYPSMYVTDIRKRFCKGISNGKLCGGTLDYDEGFNNIVCSECGRTYLASTLAKKDGDNIDILLDAVGYKKIEGVRKMKITITNESGNVINQINSGAKSSHVDSFVSNANEFDNPILDSTTKVKTEKRPKLIISEIEENTDSSIVNDRVAETPTEQTIAEKRETFIEAFNIANSGVNTEAINNTDNRALAILELAKSINNMTIDNNPYISEEDAYSIYKRVSAATMDLNQDRIDLNNIGTADTLINKMLRKISRSKIDDNMFPVFYKLMLKVKNTKKFFSAILNFYDTLLEYNSFDHTKTEDSDIYCIYNEIYDKYLQTIDTVLEDYRYYIILSGNFTYDIRNAFSIINNGISQMKFVVYQIVDSQIEDDPDFNDIDTTKWITINSSKDFVEHCFCEQTETIISETPDIIDITENQLSPVDLYDKCVSGNEKTGTRKQQKRYNKKKHQ